MSDIPVQCSSECAKNLRPYHSGYWLCDEHTEVEGYRVPVLWEDRERLKALKVMSKGKEELSGRV